MVISILYYLIFPVFNSLYIFPNRLFSQLIPCLSLIIHKIQLMSSTCAWICSHPLGHVKPTSGNILNNDSPSSINYTLLITPLCGIEAGYYLLNLY